MILAWLSAAIAAPELDPALQKIHEIEWARAEVLELAGQAAGATTPARVAAMIAAGRMRSEAALALLEGGRTDPNEEVRVATAQALAWTPGAGPSIRAWLREEPLPIGLAKRAAAEHGVVVSLVEALGHQGDQADVPLLVRYLEEPWPVGAAAARALGRFGVRKVRGADAATDELAARLDAADPRLGADVAWALSRIGMASATDADVAHALVRLRARDTYPETRARLVRAVWPRLDAATRDDLFVALATDPSKLVRVALLDALEPGDTGPEVLAAWLVDREPWIRQQAIAAIGRDGSPEAAELLLSDRATQPYARAAVVRAAKAVDAAAAGDRSLPAPVRAAYVSALKDRVALEALAADPEPAVRSAAAAQLLEDTGTPAGVGVRLLAAEDPVIREAAVELVGRASRAERVKTLVGHLARESHPDVVAAGLSSLEDAGARRPEVEGLLASLKLTDPRASLAAASLARSVGLPASAPPTRRGPQLAEVSQDRRAIVETSEGTFTIALDPEIAPFAVQNFVQLASGGFFDGMVFHRVVPGFVVQTGCPRGDGWGGPGYTIPDEVSSVPFETGSVGMARADRDTGGSQWFVTTSPQPHLTGEYTRFGEVVQGMHVVQRLGVGSEILRVTVVAEDGSTVTKRTRSAAR